MSDRVGSGTVCVDQHGGRRRYDAMDKSVKCQAESPVGEEVLLLVYCM